MNFFSSIAEQELQDEATEWDVNQERFAGMRPEDDVPDDEDDLEGEDDGYRSCVY